MGAWLVARRDRTWVHVVGAGIQALLVAGYLGLWQSSADAGDEQFFLYHLVLGVVIAAAQLVVLSLLVSLARSGREARPTG